MIGRAELSKLHIGQHAALRYATGAPGVGHVSIDNLMYAKEIVIKSAKGVVTELDHLHSLITLLKEDGTELTVHFNHIEMLDNGDTAEPWDHGPEAGYGRYW